MKLESVPTPYSISQAGSFARSCLTSGQHGQVLAVFSKAIFLQTKTGELFWVSAQDTPMHRRCARVSGVLPHPSAGSRYHVHNYELMIEKVDTLDLKRTTGWDEPGRDPAMAVSLLIPHVQVFFSSLDYSLAMGFGTFIPQLLLLSNGEPVDRLPDPTDPVLAHAYTLVMDLARACLENRHSDISYCSKKLVGLGSGLTPSGDDFLGGMAFAIHMLQFNYPDLDLFDLSQEVDHYQSRTHPISFALLSDLVQGHAIAPLHQVTNGLMCGKPFIDLQTCVSQLTSVGHSTGWDLLAGLLAGLLAISHSHYCIPSFKIIRNIEI